MLKAPFKTCLLLVLAAAVTPLHAEDDTMYKGNVGGYTSVGKERVDDAYNAGYSMYSAAWPLLREYPGHQFQSGLFGTWMFAQNDKPVPEGVKLYSDIEGGLGWWRDTEYPTETPKFIMGGVELNFRGWANGPGAGQGRDWSNPKGKYGIAQLSPWVLWPPDGLNLKQGTCGELFGSGYLPLPLIDAKSTTAGKDVPTGDRCWTLFLNTGNFKGPVAFFTPYFWSRASLDDTRLSGMFFDSRPSQANKPFSMETQHIHCAQVTDSKGQTYARMAPTQYPVGPEGDSVLLHRLTVYNKKALWDNVKAWFEGGDPVASAIDPKETCVQKFNGQGGASWRIYMKHVPKEKRPSMATNAFMSAQASDPLTFSFQWHGDLVTKRDTKDGSLVTLPQYYRLAEDDKDENGKWVAVSAEEVPAETGLASLSFSRPKERPPKAYVTPEEPESCWKTPGPVAGPFKAYPGDGSVVTYYWYRFADQPALLNADLTKEAREILQKRVEKLHRHWTKDREYLAPPTVGTLAEIDAALIVTPPKGMEVGYVPVATRQAADERPMVDKDTTEAMYNGLAARPPMGWNSWNFFHGDINEEKIRGIADQMVETGMLDAGYEYLVLDDGWMADTRAEDGKLLADPNKFPSGMKALGDYIHGKGLKYGMYQDRGHSTCMSLPGSFGYEQIDMDSFAEWGVDYLKLDSCYAEINGRPSSEDFGVYKAAIIKTGRPMILSMANYTDPSWAWGGDEIGHLWRTSFDIGPHMGSVYYCMDTSAGDIVIHPAFNGLWQFAGPGHWNDPDMLQVGNMTSDIENRTHFGLWCILAAPLMAGNDLRNMSESVRDILTHKEVLSINQDPRGIQGYKVYDDGDHEIFNKPLADGTTAVLLLNRGSEVTDITVTWDQINLKGHQKVRDLWQGKDLGKFEDAYTVSNLKQHDHVLLKVGSKGRPLPAPQPMPLEKYTVTRKGVTALSALYDIWRHGNAPKVNTTFNGKPIVIGGIPYDRGFGCKATSKIMFKLNGNADRFSAAIGLDASYQGDEAVSFKVRHEDPIGPDSILYDSGKMTKDSPAKIIDLDVTGIDCLILSFEGKQALGNWGDPEVVSD